MERCIESQQNLRFVIPMWAALQGSPFSSMSAKMLPKSPVRGEVAPSSAHRATAKRLGGRLRAPPGACRSRPPAILWWLSDRSESHSPPLQKHRKCNVEPTAGANPRPTLLRHIGAARQRCRALRASREGGRGRVASHPYGVPRPKLHIPIHLLEIRPHHAHLSTKNPPLLGAGDLIPGACRPANGYFEISTRIFSFS